MIFKKISVKNIRSYIEQEIEIPQGSVLIAGDVGSGKSSLLLAVEYALFGLQAGQKGSSLLRNSADSGKVTLELEIAGKDVIIERGLKRTQKGVANDYAIVTIEGERYESSVTEIKSKIIKLLGYPAEFVKRNNVLYKYTVHTPQEQMKQIMLDDAESRINILRHIFGMDRYKRIKDNLAVLIANLSSSAKILQGEIKSLEIDKEILESRKIKLAEIDGQVLQKNELYRQKKADKETVEGELFLLKQKIDEKKILESEIEKTKILSATKREILASLIREAEELEKEIAESPAQFKEEIYLSTLHQINSKKDYLEEINSEYHKTVSRTDSIRNEQNSLLEKNDRIFKIDICPTCLQNVSDTHKHNILNEIERNLSKSKRELKDLENERDKISANVKIIRAELELLEGTKLKLEIQKSRIHHLEKSKEKLESVKSRQEMLKKDLLLLSDHVNNLKETALKQAYLEYQFKKAEEKLRQVLLEEKNAEILLAELRKEQELLNGEISRLSQAIDKKELSKQNLQKLEKFSDWLSFQFLNLIETIERNILLNLRKEFSQLFRKWFHMLVPDNTLESQIDESFTPVVVQGETEMEYSFLSGGERTAVALAYRLALNQIINSILSKIKTQGTIILDEPTDGFSEAQIDKIRDILEELSMRQIIIVSHEHKIEGFVDNLIRVSKEGDASAVVAVEQEAYQKT